MNSFNIKRFGQTLRWVVSVNFRIMLLWFTGSILAVFLGEILFQAMNSCSTPYYAIRNISQFLTMLLMLASLILISSIVARFNEKRKREAFLMLPSSNLEKYLSLVVYSTFICIAAAFLAVVLGDSLRMLAYWAIDYQGPALPDGSHNTSITNNLTGETFYWWSSSIPLMLKNLVPVMLLDGFEGYPLDLAIIEVAFIYGGMLWIHSVYTLGGTLLRKYSFVGTTVFVILCIVLFVKIVITFNMTLFHMHWDNGVLQNYEIGIPGWVLAIAFPIISVFNYWASFQIFKGFQLLTNKWTNYDILKR